MSALSSLSIEALSASVQLDDSTESILFAVVPDRAAFEAVVQALRDDWLTLSDVRANDARQRRLTGEQR